MAAREAHYALVGIWYEQDGDRHGPDSFWAERVISEEINYSFSENRWLITKVQIWKWETP